MTAGETGPSKEAVEAAKEIQQIDGLCAFFEGPGNDHHGWHIEGISQCQLAPIIDRHFAPLRAHVEELTTENEKLRQEKQTITDAVAGVCEQNKVLTARITTLEAQLAQHEAINAGWALKPNQLTAAQAVVRALEKMTQVQESCALDYTEEDWIAARAALSTARAAGLTKEKTT